MRLATTLFLLSATLTAPAFAATAELEWPACASISMQPVTPTTFALACNSGHYGGPLTLTINHPQCPALSIWGERDGVTLDCAGTSTTAGAPTGLPLLLDVSNCPAPVVWGGGGRATVDCFPSTGYEQVQEAYIAYYGRPADPAGLAYWVGRFNAAGGSLTPIMNAFAASAEFNARYGGLTNDALVTKVYQQTLGRDPDASGLAFYVGKLNAGAYTLGTVAIHVLDGAAVRPDATVIANRLHVAAYYTEQVAAGCAYGSAAQDASLLASVTAQTASVTAAVAAINAACGT
jgi:hypothetical protein